MNASAPVLRRLGAAGYDLLIVVALWMLAYFPLIASGLLSGALDDSAEPGHLMLRAAITFAYFGWSWTHGGRTLGALAWRLAVERDDGAALGARDAMLRFGVALGYLAPLAVLELMAPAGRSLAAFLGALVVPFLLGTLWCRSDPHGRALHELPLGTRLVQRPTESR